MEDNCLLANDHQIFPRSRTATCAIQQLGNAEGLDVVPVGYKTGVVNMTPPFEFQETELFHVRLNILNLASYSILVDDVAITLVQGLVGDLYIAKIEVAKGALSPHLPYRTSLMLSLIEYMRPTPLTQDGVASKVAYLSTARKRIGRRQVYGHSHIVSRLVP